MSWVRNAFVGQRVVCIDDSFLSSVDTYLKKIGYVNPKKYDILTIREIRSDAKAIGILFKEIRNPAVSTTGGFIEVAFRSERFKPLDESRLDVFRAMLVEKPQHADA